MSNIIFKNKTHMGVTLLKNIFIDHYMINANGEYVKIYIYILRCLDDSQLFSKLSVNHLADVFDCTEKDILRALKYWENAGLVTMETTNGQLSAITINELGTLNEPSVATATTVTTETKDSKNISQQRLNALSSQTDVKQLLCIAQTYMGKTLNATEINTILFFYDNLHLSVDLIEYLLEYCASNNHKSFHYIEKVGIAWHEAGITTPAEAKEFAGSFSNAYFSIMKAFGITGRAPAQAEKDYIDKWMNTYGFRIDLIIEACNRTISSIHQPSFKYADSILCRWKEKNIHSSSDLRALDEAHEKRKATNLNTAAKQAAMPNTKKTAFNNFQQSEYDFNAIEKALLNGGK